MIDRIVIVGAGRTSESLIQRLSWLAPVTVVDKSAAAIDALGVLRPDAAIEPADAPSAPDAGVVRVRHDVRHLLEDATSRLVLQDLRGAAESNVGLVAATSDDRVNLEVCRLGVALDFHPLIAIVIDPAKAPAYAELGVRAIVRATLLGDVVERTLRYDGIAVATQVGLGKGEIVEVRILGSSPVIGEPLARLDPEGWRVAAIYRAGELVIPTGQTVIAEDDRVLLVGDPALLPHVAENLRAGAADFPLRTGPHVVAYLPRGGDPTVDTEAALLRDRTRARGLIRVLPGGVSHRAETGGEARAARTSIPPPPAEVSPRWTDDAPLEAGTIEAHGRTLFARAPGVIVAAPSQRTTTERVVGRVGAAGVLCNMLPVPVLFARGASAYNRVIHVVGGTAQGPRVADAAIDLARMFEAPLVLVQAELPAYLGGADARVTQALAAAERRAQMHRVAVSVQRLHGNPVAEIIKFAATGDLVVLARRRARRDSFTSPDVALRVARAARASVLIWTE